MRIGRLIVTAAAAPVAFLLITGIAAGQSSEQTPGVQSNPAREAYFGDLHLHTSYSFDAYTATSITPEEAYRFARGEQIRFLGGQVKRAAPPLDFLAVTDHSENIGVFRSLDERDSPLSRSEFGREAHKQGKSFVLQTILSSLSNGRHGNLSRLTGVSAQSLKATAQTAWQRTIEAANRNYQPGRFTTFIGYEWTCMVNWQNLHRNVIFRGDDAPIPFTSIDSCRPEELWTFLENVRKQGYEALAIPHNANASNGLMFDWVDSYGKRIDRAYAQLRTANEPLLEIVQIKGQSETHPALSPNDEFANFEILDFVQSSRVDAASRPAGSYARDAVGRGLEIAQTTGGVNPYKYGFVGASDDHYGLSDSVEGVMSTYAEMISASAVKAISYALSSPGLTGVWAEQNTRESIYAAFRRKETFATSGTRLKLRFFGGWQYSGDLNANKDWVATAYSGGVPMGGDMPPAGNNAKAPKFVAWALKDPGGANLDRLQVIKVSLTSSGRVEKIYDVAFSAGRPVNRGSNEATSVGNTVDVQKARYANTIGATELSAVWEDPQFDPTVASAYYLRVLEIPTPRHSTITAVKQKQPLPVGVALTIQERGWSSPIWYEPVAGVTGCGSTADCRDRRRFSLDTPPDSSLNPPQKHFAPP